MSIEEMRREIAELRREVAELRSEVAAMRQPQVVPIPIPAQPLPWNPRYPWEWPVITCNTEGTA